MRYLTMSKSYTAVLNNDTGRSSLFNVTNSNSITETTSEPNGLLPTEFRLKHP